VLNGKQEVWEGKLERRGESKEERRNKVTLKSTDPTCLMCCQVERCKQRQGARREVQAEEGEEKRCKHGDTSRDVQGARCRQRGASWIEADPTCLMCCQVERCKQRRKQRGASRGGQGEKCGKGRFEESIE
jgi:hypothetical protein